MPKAKTKVNYEFCYLKDKVGQKDFDLFDSMIQGKRIVIPGEYEEKKSFDDEYIGYYKNIQFKIKLYKYYPQSWNCYVEFLGINGGLVKYGHQFHPVEAFLKAKEYIDNYRKFYK
jgi:hypothetical protein